MLVSTCPSRYSPRRITREPLSRSSTPKPHFSCLRAAPRRNTREKLSHTRTRDTMCVAASRSPGRMLHCAQPLLSIPHPTYYSQNYPPVSAPRCNPFGCSCSPPCNPPRRRLLLFPFFQFGLGGGKRATPSPLFSLHPASPVFYHPRGFLACSGRFSFPPLRLRSLSLSLSLSLSPGGQPKEKYLYLSVSSRDICLPLRPSRPLALPRAIRSVSFSFFSTPPPPWSFSVSPTPFSVSRYLSVSLPYSCSLSLPRFLSFFRPSPYLHPTTLLPTARVVAGETDTVGVSEPDRQRKGERRRVVGKREEKKEAKDGGYHDDDDDVDDDAGGRGEACAPFLGRRRDKETRRNRKGWGER